MTALQSCTARQEATTSRASLKLSVNSLRTKRSQDSLYTPMDLATRVLTSEIFLLALGPAVLAPPLVLAPPEAAMAPAWPA